MRLPSCSARLLISPCVFMAVGFWGVVWVGMSHVSFADDAPGESVTGRDASGSAEWREPVEFTRRSLQLPGYVQPALAAAGDKAVFAVAFSEDAKWMATGNAAGQVLLHRTGEAEVQREMVGEHAAIVRDLQFLSGGKFLASLDIEGRLLLWSTGTVEKVQELAPIDQVLAIDVGSDDGRLIALSEGTALQVWEPGDDRWHETQDVSLDTPGSLLSVSGDANVAVVVSQPNVWQVHRVPASVVGQAEKNQAGDVVSEEPFTADSNGLNAISAVRVSPNGSRVALGWDDGSITVHLTADGSEEFRWKKHPNRVTSLRFSKTGKTLLSGCFRDRIRVWDLASGQHVNDRDVGLELVAAMELTDEPQRLFDSKHLFVGTYKGSVLCIDLETGVELARLEPLPEHMLMPVRDIDYDAKTETLVAVGGYDGQESMRLYSLKDVFPSE